MSDAREERGGHAPGGVAQARQALVAWIDEAGAAGRVFLQLRLLALGGGRYEVRNARDVHRSHRSLEWVSDDPFRAREFAQTTNAGAHRPLKTSPNLRQGWVLDRLDAGGLCTALDYLYPAAVVHWHAARTGTLRVTHWRETAARQTGIYGAVRLLEPPALEDAVQACCADAVCLRRVAWGVDEAQAAPLLVEEGEPAGDARVPCPEACSLFISLAREVVKLERAPRTEVPGLGSLGPAELEQLRELAFAAAEGATQEPREGEFELGTNPRRLRYLAARLRRAAAAPAAPELPCEGCPRAVPCVGCPLAEATAA